METKNPSPEVVSVAQRFADLLHVYIGEHMPEVLRRNAARTESSVCHSHDFCDSNMVMCLAIQHERGLTEDQVCDLINTDEGCALWSNAWTLAVRNRFARTPDHLTPYRIEEAAHIAAAIAAHSGDDEELRCALDPKRAAEACGMFDDREARCGWQRDAFAHAFELVSRRTPWAAFIADHPAIARDVSTGGGCMAWTLDLPTGEQLMFTSGEDGGYQPAPSDDTVTIGYYDARGEWDEINRPEYSWSEAVAFVAGFMAGKAAP